LAKKNYKYKKGSLVIGHKPDGKPIRKWVYGKTVAEKNAKLAELKRLYTSGLHLGVMTVNEWAERWQNTFLANVSIGQQGSHKRTVKSIILPKIGFMKMRDVRLSHLLEITNPFKGGKKGTVTKQYQTLRRLFEDAELEGIIDKNPAIRLKLPEVTQKPRRPLNATERNALLKVAETHPRGAYALTMLYSGARRGECIALTRSDIDFENKRLNISKQLHFEESNVGKLSKTKSAKLRKSKKAEDDVGTRAVPIPDLLLSVLTVLCEGKEPNDLLFTNMSGNVLSRNTTQCWWHSIKRQCHLQAGAKTKNNAIIKESSPFDDTLSPHYLRHTYASDLHAAGVDKFTRQAFLGHANSDVTDDYTAMTEEAFSRNLNLINLYLNEAKWDKKGAT